MAVETWHVSSNWRFTADVGSSLPTSTPPAAPDLIQRNAAGFSIYNDVGSNSVVTLRRLTLCDRTRQEISTYPVFTHNYLYVTNSADLPTNVQEPITPIKLDTNNANVDSHVIAGRIAHWTSLPALSQANPQMTRKILLFPNLRTDPQTGNPFAERSLANLNTSVIKVGIDNTVDFQPIRLQAGNQFSLMLGTAWSLPKQWELSVLVRIGTSCYLYRAPIIWGNDVTSAQGMQGFTLYNGAGSSVVPEIMDVKLTENTPDTDGSGAPDQWTRPLFALETISYLFDGTPLTPVPYDTTNSAFPSSVRLRAGGTAIQVGKDALLGNAWGNGPIRRSVMACQGISAATFGGTAGFRFPNGTHAQHRFYDSDATGAVEGMVLRPGEGISLMQKDTLSGVGNFDVECTFTIVTTPTAGPGYSRGRVVNR